MAGRAGGGVGQAELETPLQVGLPVAVAGFETEALAPVARLDGEIFVYRRRDRSCDLLSDASVEGLVGCCVTGCCFFGRCDLRQRLGDNCLVREHCQRKGKSRNLARRTEKHRSISLCELQ